MYYDKLQEITAPLKKDRKTMIFLIVPPLIIAGFFLVFSIVTLNPKGVIAVAFFVLFGLLGLSRIIELNRLLKQINTVSARNINKTYEVALYRPKIKYLMRTAGKYSVYLYGIIVYDGNKNKYFYFLDEEIYRPNSAEYQKFQEEFYKAKSIRCFENTKVISDIEKHPYFSE